jgi:hypothetical protein
MNRSGREEVPVRLPEEHLLRGTSTTLGHHAAGSQPGRHDPDLRTRTEGIRRRLYRRAPAGLSRLAGLLFICRRCHRHHIADRVCPADPGGRAPRLSSETTRRAGLVYRADGGDRHRLLDVRPVLAADDHRLCRDAQPVRGRCQRLPANRAKPAASNYPAPETDNRFRPLRAGRHANGGRRLTVCRHA